MKEITSSPMSPVSPVPAKPKPDKEAKGMTFAEALDAVVKGKQVARREWTEVDCYGFLRDDMLMIHRNGADHTWTVSLGDIEGKDWFTHEA